MKKLLSWILTLAMVLSLAPMGVFAAEPETVAQITSEPETVPETPVESGTYEIPFQANPLYREAYEQGVLPIPEPEEPASEEETLQGAPEVLYATYVTPERAAEQLRRGMTQRTVTVNLYVRTDNSDYKAVGNEIVDEALEHTGKPKEGDYLLWHYAGWSAQVKVDYRNSTYYYDYAVQLSYYTTAAQEREMDTAVTNLLRTLNVGNKRDYEKVKAVYDYVCQNITYDYANLNDQSYMLKHTAYAALLHKTAVCQGYASLIYRMLLELGVDNRVIAGESAGGPHGWNIVKLGDVYYNLDSTWDAETGDYLFFLRNQDNFLGHYRYLDYATTQFHMTYPMSGTDYVDGVAGVAEYEFVKGICGDNAWWGVNRENVLTIYGTGQTYDYQSTSDMSKAAPWMFWSDGIQHVVVEEGITALGRNIFESYHYPVRQIESVTLPDSLETIGENAFKKCGKLAQIHWGNGLKAIGNSAFAECYELKEVRLPAGLKTLGDHVFYSCANLETVIFNDGLESIGGSAFRDCTKLKQIHIPGSVKTIGVAAFWNCDSLTEVTIPANVEKAQGFRECDNLETAYVYSATVGSSAFYGCKKLRNVYLSDNVTKLEDGAFWGCESLEVITLPAGVTELGTRCFDGCSNLRNLVIPAGVTTIGVNVVSGCRNLEAVWFTGDAPQMNLYTFYGYNKIIYYPAGNPTWTAERMQELNTNATWIPYCYAHQYEVVTYTTTCVRDGGTFYTCKTCNHSYVENLQYATGLHIFAHDLDTTCETCGYVRPIRESRPVVHMFRMYDPNSGEHFYTGSEEERDNLVAAGWNYEGVGFTFPLTTGDPVYRLYDPVTGEHLYTMDVAEKDDLLSRGWNYEGIAFNSAFADEVPQYRLHNPNATRGAYHFTSSVEERDFLIAAGWEYQGIGWYSCWK